jgi:asparagine synthase (glutamine-hydrolysing)
LGKGRSFIEANMCGIAGIISTNPDIKSYLTSLNDALDSIRHRGPDAKQTAIYSHAALGHVRLSIIDLNETANQPMISNCGRYIIVYNGEVYNYLEIREKIKHRYDFKTNSDTEVILAYYVLEGKEILNDLNGMFAFAIWDNQKQMLFGARDRFGVKPFYYSNTTNGDFVFASEIKALHESKWMPKDDNLKIWAQYLVDGIYDHTDETFFEGIYQISAGSCFSIDVKQSTQPQITKWYYGLNEISLDTREQQVIEEELLFLLEDSVRLRFRADVPIGVCLSGGLDSSLLFALIQKVKGKEFPIHAFTFYTGDENYDELPWVNQVLENTSAMHHKCLLKPLHVMERAKDIQYYMDGPYGGVPTIGMNRVFEEADKQGIKVLLDGNGMDEAWGGYEYYQRLDSVSMAQGPVQGAKEVMSNLRFLTSTILDHYNPWEVPNYSRDRLINAQILDLMHRKIPRGMRFADRNSMQYSVELREPFLDYRIVELGLKQPETNKIQNLQGKYLVRKLIENIISRNLVEAPKRPLQTPQREWFAGELFEWLKEEFSKSNPQVISTKNALEILANYKNKPIDNSFYLWQIKSTTP